MNERYQSLVEEVLEHVDVGILIRDPDRRVVWANGAFRRYAGGSRLTLDGAEIRVGDRWLEHRVKRIDRGEHSGGSVELLYDVTQRKLIEDSLHAGQVGVWDWNLDTDTMVVDPVLKMILGYQPFEVRDHIDAWSQLVHPEDAPLVKRAAREHISGRSPRYEIAHRMMHKDGTERWFLARGSVVRDKAGRAVRMAGTHTNITDHKAAEQKLRQSLEEKETLLKEVHHRVKNNLQIISSLLHMQARHFHDEEARALVLECQDRIRSMALVHEMLYASEGVAKIDFGEYVSDLAEKLRASHGAKAASVEVAIQVDGAVLDLDTAVHLGLILNEIISNAFKHAFPKGRGGHLRIGLAPVNGGLHLTVSDDGVGLPPSFDLETQGTLGIQLVRAVSSQIGATVHYQSMGGTLVRIEVPRMGG